MAKVIHLREYAGGFEQTEELAAREMVRLLNQTRMTILDRLSDIAPEKFEARHLQAIMAEVDEQLARFQPQAIQAIAGGSQQAFANGAAVVDKVIADTPLILKMPVLGEKLLDQAAAFNADLVTNLTGEIRAKINTEVQLGVLGAKNPADIRKAIGTNLKDKSIFKTIADRAETITRTEVGRVYSMATDERMKQVAEIEPGVRKFWIATPGPRTRDSHVAAGNKYTEDNPIPVDEYFVVGGAKLRFPRDPAGPAEETINCFPGDTEVSGENIQAGMRRWYEGPLCEIITAFGHKLAGTPNHPILTDRGWIALGKLKKGDSVISSGFAQGVSFSNPDIQDMPSQIGQMFNAVSNIGTSQRHLGMSLDFHGDGFTGDIDVVFTDGKLGNRFDTSRAKPASQLPLSVSDFGQSSLFSKSGFVQQLVTFLSASDRSIGRLCLLAALFQGHLTPLQPFGLARVARLHASFKQSFSNSASINSITLGQDILRFTSQISLCNLLYVYLVILGATYLYTCAAETACECGSAKSNVESNLRSTLASEISFDSVTKIRRAYFKGHVYNLQTKTGWYVANNIIAHNCRCDQGIILPEGAGEER